MKAFVIMFMLVVSQYSQAQCFRIFIKHKPKWGESVETKMYEDLLREFSRKSYTIVDSSENADLIVKTYGAVCNGHYADGACHRSRGYIEVLRVVDRSEITLSEEADTIFSDAWSLAWNSVIKKIPPNCGAKKGTGSESSEVGP
jgi:hypothetical protein